MQSGHYRPWRALAQRPPTSSSCSARSAIARAAVLASTTDWGESGRRPGSTWSTSTSMRSASPRCSTRGYSVLSEESGLQHPARRCRSAIGTVVVDPLDGSTNASLGLPWCATSLCLVVDGVPSVVDGREPGHRCPVHRGSGRRARRSTAARSAPIGPQRRSTTPSSRSAGCPTITTGGASSGRWVRRRSTSARWRAGTFDAFVDMSPDAHGVWDYLGAVARGHRGRGSGRRCRSGATWSCSITQHGAPRLRRRTRRSWTNSCSIAGEIPIELWCSPVRSPGRPNGAHATTDGARSPGPRVAGETAESDPEPSTSPR